MTDERLDALLCKDWATPPTPPRLTAAQLAGRAEARARRLQLVLLCLASLLWSAAGCLFLARVLPPYGPPGRLALLATALAGICGTALLSAALLSQYAAGQGGRQ